MLAILLKLLLIVHQVRAVSVPSEVGEDIVQAIYNDVERVENGSFGIHVGAECSSCYDELGCFDRCNGVFHYIRELPQSPEKISTQFTLFSRLLSPQSDSQIIQF